MDYPNHILFSSEISRNKAQRSRMALVGTYSFNVFRLVFDELEDKEMTEYYIKLIKDWRFTKDNQEYPQFGIGGLRYRSEYTLKLVSKMSVGESVKIHNYTLKRIL